MCPKEIVVDKDVLYDLYIKQNLLREEVAEKLGLKENLVKRKLHKFGIKKSVDGHIANIRKSCMKKFGLPNGGWAPKTQAKIKKTNKERYGSESYLQCEDYKKKTADTLAKRGVVNVFQLEEVKEKSANTMVRKYGARHNSQVPSIQKKRSETKRKNGTFHTSKPEQEIKKLLEGRFPDLEYQYRSELYPFSCDFYIPSLDLYIEYQGTWTHGRKPFEGTEEDLQLVEKWKRLSEKSSFYKNAVYVWTKSDILKRETARKNDLNWIEFFSFEQFLDWFYNLG